MTHPKKRTYSRYTQDAALFLGKQIQLARKERHLTATDLADRIGISRVTLQKIEKGELTCELGIVLEAAALVGVPLFDIDPIQNTFSVPLERVNDKIALLPKRIRKHTQDVDDDF